MAAWQEYQATLAGGGSEVARAAALESAPAAAIPACTAEEVRSRLGAGRPAVWAMTSPAEGAPLLATVNLPVAGILVSEDQGDSWHWRHVFLRGYNLDRDLLLCGIDFRRGLLAVATEQGILLSRDGARSFVAGLAGRPFSAVAIAPGDDGLLVAGGDQTSFLSEDGGGTWRDLGFSAFTARLPTANRYLNDEIVSLRFDPHDRSVFYAGTGSHLYRYTLRRGTGDGQWQAMEGDGASGRVADDSTVYHIETGSRLMISTCNGVYYLERSGARQGDQADVRWGKFRDPLFSGRGVGGPRGNLRSYFVAEDPFDPARLLVADFAGLYEGRREGERVHWRRVESLPFYNAADGYPEYTAISWTVDGRAVVGSRYRGIFVQEREPAPPRGSAGASCFLR